MTLMKKLLTSIAFAGSLLMAPAASAVNVDELGANYHKLGTAIVDMVNSRAVNVAKVEETVLELTKISVALSNEYKRVHPAGSKLLDITANQAAVVSNGKVTGLGPMVTLSFKEIEEKWHDLGFVATQDVGVNMDDEDNEHFTDPLHVMIHPIMVLRAARDFDKSKSDDDLNNMKAEMEEGMEQAALLLEVVRK